MNGILQSLAGIVTGCAGCDSAALSWLQTASDGAMALACLALAAGTGVFLRRRADERSRGALAALLSFFAAAGLVRLLAAAPSWSPGRAALIGATDLGATLLSLAAAFMLWRALPHVLAQPSSAEMARLSAKLRQEAAAAVEAAARLREAEARQRAIYGNIPVPIHTLDPEGGIVSVSDQWLILFGYTREEVVGRKLTQFLAPESAGRLAEGWQLLLAHGAEQDVERQVRCKSGELRDVLASARVLRDEGGAVTGVQGVLVDIAARRRAEAALRQPQKAETIGQLAGGLAQIAAFGRQSGGMLRLHGTEGVGARVELRLPRTEPALPAAAEAREARPTRTGPAGGESVLVVEDEIGVRQVVIEALEGLGYRVLAAGDAEEALGVLEAHPEIDLLFTDIVMPGGMDGVDLALEATRRRPDLPVLFTTGYSNRALAGRWAGDVGLLQKPYRIEALAQQIRARLGTRDNAGNTGRTLRAAGA